MFSFKSRSLRFGKPLLPHKVSSLECYYFYYHVHNGSYANVIGLAFHLPFKNISHKEIPAHKESKVVQKLTLKPITNIHLLFISRSRSIIYMLYYV